MGDSYQRRVARGARLLDQEYPGWHKVVDAEALLMQSSVSCILGQTYKDSVTSYQDDGFEAGTQALGLSMDEKDSESVFAYGFDAPESRGNKYDDGYDKLAYHWRGEIGKRLIRDGQRILRGLK